MTHATVRIAGYNLPLIGIDQSATEEKCDGCKRVFHLSEVKLDQGRFMCWSCRMREMIYNKEIFYGPDKDLPQQPDQVL